MIAPRPLLLRIARPLATGILTLASAAALQAQEPFAQNFVPTFSFTENYVESVDSMKDDEGFREYFVAPNRSLSSLTVTAKLSAVGVDIDSFDAETPFAIAIGDFEVAGVLGDDETYTTGKTSIRIPLMDENEDGEPIKVGQAVISWNKKEINVSVTADRPETYFAMAPNFLGADEPAIEEVTTCRFALGEHELVDRTVYVKGRASVSTKKVGSGDDEQEFDVSTVKISGAIDSVRPKIRVNGLENNQIVTSSSLTLDVTATDNREEDLSVVQVKLNDDEEYTPLNLDEDGNWSSEALQLNLGDNVLQVMAIDADGNESLIEQLTVRYWLNLVVNIEGEGSVTKGFSGTSPRESGKQFTITAKPAKGYIFAGWKEVSDPVAQKKPELTFTMAEGLVFTAKFIKNPFPDVEGTYNSLLTPETGAGMGSVSLDLTPSGSFTAKIALNGLTKSLKGSFDSDGRFTGTVSLDGTTTLNVDLQLGVGENANSLTGTISDGTNVIKINGERNLYTNKAPAPEAGSYTVVLPASDLTENPQGYGYATLKITKTGATTIAGALGDGTTFSYGGTISSDGTLGVYFTPYKNKGIVYGAIKVYPEGTPNPNDLDGTLYWVKNQDATSDGFYIGGINTTTALIGSRFEVPAKKQPVIALDEVVSPNAKVYIGEGGILPLEKDATLTTTNQLKVAAVSPAAPDKLKITITPGQGLFSGDFFGINEADTKKVKRTFKGVFLQKQKFGAGVFLGAGSAGYIEITAPPTSPE